MLRTQGFSFAGMRTFPRFNPYSRTALFAETVGSCLAPEFPACTCLMFEQAEAWQEGDIVLLEMPGKLAVKQISAAPDGQGWLLLCKQPAVLYRGQRILGPLVAAWPGPVDVEKTRLMDEEGARFSASVGAELASAGVKTIYCDLRRYGEPHKT